MDTELMLDVGQANELKLAFRRAGWTNAEIKKLCEGNLLAHLLPLVREHVDATTVTTQHLIDCDADPFIPNGWTVESHKKGGRFAFDPAKIRLYLSPNQQGGKHIEGTKLLRKELANEPVLNANILDFLLKNPYLIPEEWKKDANGNIRYIFFWGTIYRLSNGDLYVRSMYWLVGSWYWLYDWLGRDWRGIDPAAVLAS